MAQQNLRSYANSSVTPSRSKEQIEGLLLKVEAAGFRWSNDLRAGKETLEAVLEWKDKSIGFRLSVCYEDERGHRQQLRALYWYLKAKIEAIQFGLVDLEREFMPYLLTASGKTLYDELGGPAMNLLPEGVSGPSELAEVE